MTFWDKFVLVFPQVLALLGQLALGWVVGWLLPFWLSFIVMGGIFATTVWYVWPGRGGYDGR